MNKQGQVWGIIIFVGLLFILTAFALIEPLTSNLNVVRNESNLNCPDVVGFDQADFDNQTAFTRLVYRPTCVVTGFSMVWLVVGFVFAVLIWVTKNIKKTGRNR